MTLGKNHDYYSAYMVDVELGILTFYKYIFNRLILFKIVVAWRPKEIHPDTDTYITDVTRTGIMLMSVHFKFCPWRPSVIFCVTNSAVTFNPMLIFLAFLFWSIFMFSLVAGALCSSLYEYNFYQLLILL